MNKKLVITPKTKVGELLDEYPELEDVLIELVPTFKKLKNPVLRKTIARITSLQQAAKVGEIDLDKLINVLRKEIGQDLIENSYSNDEDSTVKPEWFSVKKISNSFDAREAIAAGQHPMEDVLKGVNALGDNEIFEFITPFMPAPLIDKVLAMGCSVWTQKEGTAFYNYFIKIK